MTATTLPTFTPKILTVMREGYGLASLRADVMAGLTVAIVALPLSMAIAIGSGVGPERGLYTSIVGGFIVSLLGGSRYQIGGPAGAFIVLVLACTRQYGVDGLFLATMMAGLIMLAAGLLRVGAFIKFVPYPVTVGFTAGIAVIIFASQIRDLLGITLTAPEPGPLLPKLAALAAALPTARPATIAVALLTIAIIVAIRQVRPTWPVMLIAVTITSLAAAAAHLPVETIGTHFGGIPSSLPAPTLPPVTLAKIQELFPTALSFALLGSIESLLSAVVADSMGGGRHRSNMELIAQGLANIVSPLFGGITVTGTIARTATNVRSGSRGPISGMLHCLFVLLFMLVAAPLASYIPLAALAGLLAVVCWNMAERHAFAALLRTSRADAAIVLATFGITLLWSLTEGIVAGIVIAALLFLRRMATSAIVEQVDEPPPGALAGEIVTIRITGAFFFGSAGIVADALDRIGAQTRAYILDLTEVVDLDSSAIAALRAFITRARRARAEIYLTGATRPIRRMLLATGLRSPTIHFATTPQSATTAATTRLHPSSPSPSGRGPG